MKTGTCDACNRADVEVVRDVLAIHAFKPGASIRANRCPGSEARSVEIRAKERARRLAKKEATLDAICGNTAVVLDALLVGRNDLDVEFTLAGFRLPAARRYAMLTGQRLPTYGTHWASSRSHHNLHCAYCGYLIVTIRRGYWSQITVEERVGMLERHTMICALQMLAGLRTPVTPGATLQDPDHEMLYAKTSALLPPELARACPECEAPCGLPCVGTTKPNTDRGEEEERMRRRKRVHAVRRDAVLVKDPDATAIEEAPHV